MPNLILQNLCVQSKREAALVYSATFLIRKICVQNKPRAAFFSLLSYFWNTKKCVQNKREAAFWFIKLVVQYEKYVLKTSGGLLFSLFIINQTPDVQLCSKQVGADF